MAIVRYARRVAGMDTVAATAVIATDVAATAVTTMLSFESLAESMVSQLLHAWPDCFQGVPPLTITFGTLCSGLDIVKPFLLALVSALNKQLGDPRINMVLKFGCELDPSIQRVRNMVANDPCYDNVLSLPEDISDVSLLLAGFSCKSVSTHNNKRHSILKVDGKGTSSGRTLKGVLKYVAAKQPPIVLLENVPGLLRNIPLSECHGEERPRNIDILIQQLATCGYHVGYKLVNAYPCLPQRRLRVYIWAERKACSMTDDVVNTAWQQLVGCVAPRVNATLDACLRHA